MADTTYVVFEKNGGDGYKRVAMSTAATPKAAISQYVDDRAKQTEDGIEGTFAAVPLRNWTELPVGVEVVTRIKVG